MKKMEETSVEKLNQTFEGTNIDKQNFWIFQANPDRFDASHWWHDMKLAGQWRINKRHRDRIKEMGIDAIWVSRANEDDLWSIRTEYREKIAHDEDLQAAFLAEKFDYWSVFQHENEIHKGDMAAIWVAGKGGMAGIYAIVELMTDPYFHPFPTEGNIRYWVKRQDREKLTKMPWLIVSIHYIKLVDPPWAPLISRSSIFDDEELVDLTILRFSQTTNLGPIPPNQWRRIMELAGLSLKT